MGWWSGRRAAAETERMSWRSLEILAVMGKSWRRGIFNGVAGWVDEGENGTWVEIAWRPPAVSRTP